MKKIKRYYKNLGFIRALACIAILLYHMNILKGGYLAVCTFFVLSAYLSCTSCFKKDKFSFKFYYVNKFKHIYLPLLFVTFISIAVISLFPGINWFNLKPETTSVILGYNNFWQLNANLDYFARHVSSPFMHFWYMGIMLQFDLVFPFIFVPLRKLGDKISKILPCVISSLIALGFTIYFYKSSLSANIMMTYYNTFTRIFSLFLGVAFGFIRSYYGGMIPKFLKSKKLSKFMFIFYLLIMIVLYCVVDASSKYFAIAMIVTSIITCRLIDYGTLKSNIRLSTFDKIIKSLSGVSYEIYLVQYPIIFLFQNVSMTMTLKYILIVALVFVISYLIHIGLHFQHGKKFKLFRIVIFAAILIFSNFGLYKYIISKDHTQEMKDLEEKLALNEKMMEEKQKEYLNKLKEEEENWTNTLKDLENGEKELESIVSNLSIVGIGDSVMLGAINNLYKQFPNGYFDAQVSRTAWVANGILQKLKDKGMLGDNIVINLGSNGDCPTSCKREIMNTIGERNVFWLTNTNDDSINRALINFAKGYPNIYVIDWKSISAGHPEYFISDKIHLTESGRKVFTQTIYDEIYKVYLEEYNKKKQEILDSYEQKQKNKLTFIGNDILLNVYDYLKEDFQNADFLIDSELNYELLKKELEKRQSENTLTHKIVFMFDKESSLNENQYKDLMELCGGKELYILDSTGILKSSYEGVVILDFYTELLNNPTYMMPDKIHLSDEGNKVLSDIMYENIIYDRDLK